MYFTKQKISRQISPDNVVLSYFFCFPLLPVLWHEKSVQMIKMFKKKHVVVFLYFVAFFFLFLKFDVNKNQADNIRILHSLAKLSVCDCSWKCECSWKQVADIFTDNKHSVKPQTETLADRQAEQHPETHLLPLHKEAEVGENEEVVFPSHERSWHLFTTSLVFSVRLKHHTKTTARAAQQGFFLSPIQPCLMYKKTKQFAYTVV